MFRRWTTRAFLPLAALLLVAALGGVVLSGDSLSSPDADDFSSTFGGCSAPTMNCYSTQHVCVNSGTGSFYYKYQGVPWIGGELGDGAYDCLIREHWGQPNCTGMWGGYDWWGTPC